LFDFESKISFIPRRCSRDVADWQAAEGVGRSVESMMKKSSVPSLPAAPAQMLIEQGETPINGSLMIANGRI